MAVEDTSKQKLALTIAGFDPSSGAGVTADLLTFAAHGVFGCACPTAMTVQSTLGVRRVETIDERLVAEILEALDEDLSFFGIKIGMLGSPGIVAAVCDFLDRSRSRKVVVVLDPVIRASSGAELLEPEALILLRERLLPLVTVATPNQSELFALLGENRRAGDLEEASQKLADRYSGLQLVVTGGDESSPNDLVVAAGVAPFWLVGNRVETASTHGTGCAFSSALLCSMIAGETLPQAARDAKRYVEAAMRFAPAIGHGKGPLHLLWTKERSGSD